ncbi:MAG: ATP-dependent protease ATPase subunit HslU, partial [Candidatus Cloacimonetes bacterium]|nr:ATP-dependent protease ATPase subunit HslU [Candidatus Cloacimonadota bacterium]
GPTGVGKTEISRRLSKLANAPFIKVEATKFTEVGYVGRDVESMIRELMNIAINDVREELMQEVQDKAKGKARKRILEIIYPTPPSNPNDTEEEAEARTERTKRNRQKMAKRFDDGELNEREIEVKINKANSPHIEIFSNAGMENIDLQIGEMMKGILPIDKSNKSKKMRIDKAFEYFIEEESSQLVKKEKVTEIAKNRVENDGIIFIDEIDKIAVASHSRGAGEVSRAGVQRDLLPIIEGSNVPTKHGIINTSHILFIAAGAFNMSKPSDLIPELQGRFPIRVELQSLTKEDLEKILIYPKNSLTKQYEALFEAEEVKLKFNKDAIKEIANFAANANEKMEDIGARRLHTIMNTLLEDYLFDMPEKKTKSVSITKTKTKGKLEEIIRDEDLSKYIL